MRQRVTSPDGSLAQSAISFLWRAAAARQVESACSCAIESCSFWYVVAAASAAGCFHLYCSTKHCAAPCAFIVILLHSRNSAAFWAAVLKHARANRVGTAARQTLVQRIRASADRDDCQSAPHSSAGRPLRASVGRDRGGASRELRPVTTKDVRRNSCWLSGGEDPNRRGERCKSPGYQNDSGLPLNRGRAERGGRSGTQSSAHRQTTGRNCSTCRRRRSRI